MSNVGKYYLINGNENDVQNNKSIKSMKINLKEIQKREKSGEKL